VYMSVNRHGRGISMPIRSSNDGTWRKVVLSRNLRRQMMAVIDLRRHSCNISAVRSVNNLLLHRGMGGMMMRADIRVARVEGMRMRIVRWPSLAVRLIYHDIRILSIGSHNNLCRRLHVMGMLRWSVPKWAGIRKSRLLRRTGGR
jgi:hypothetical protein